MAVNFQFAKVSFCEIKIFYSTQKWFIPGPIVFFEMLKSEISFMLKDYITMWLFNGWQLAKMKKSIPDMSLSWSL